MKKNYLLLKFCLIIAVMSFLSPAGIFGQTLTHAYTFEDGTAKDTVGSADGTLVGGTIADGAYTASANGEYIEFPASEIAINTYSAITVEAFIKADIDITWSSMMAYFGDTNPDNGYGINYLFVTPDRNTQSYASISCLELSSPWGAENGIGGDPVSVGNKHHVVCVLTNSTIDLYIDGAAVGASGTVSGNNTIANISTAKAMLCKGGYNNDNTWQGTVYEYNIYDGAMDATTVYNHYVNYVGDDYFNANLASITTNTSSLSPEFDAGTEAYEIWLDYGIKSITLDAIPEVEGATVQMFDGNGNEIIDGVVTYPPSDGTDVEIIVTALDGSTEKSYYVSIFVYDEEKSANLSSIDLSAGSLNKEFHPDTLEYYAIIPYGTTSVDVTGVPAWDGAAVTGDGTVDLSDGIDTMVIYTTSEDVSTAKEYTVYLYVSKVTPGQYYYFQHESSGYVIGDSREAFNLITLHYPNVFDTTQLIQLEPSGVDDQYFLKSKTNNYLRLSDGETWDLLMTPDLTTNLDSCRFMIHEFEPGRFRIETVVKSDLDGKYIGTNNNNIYTGIYSDKWIDNTLAIWNINPPAEVIPDVDLLLADLTIDQGKLIPVFDSVTPDYNIVFPVGTTTVNVSATAHDASASVTGTGSIDVSDGAGTITLTVVGANPENTKDYRIHYLVNTPLTKKHSYTFADGTARDVVGNVDGTVEGGGMVKDGMFTSSNDGDYINLSGDELKLSSYPSITLEAYIATDGSNTNKYTMLTYFGGDRGANSYWIQPTRADGSGLSRTEASGVTVTGSECDDASTDYHIVSILTYDTLYYYINGVLQGRVFADNLVTKIGTKNALIGESGWPDPSWIGSIYEFNIYSGEMDPDTIAAHAAAIPVEDSTHDATLSDLQVDGATIEGFSPYTLTYNLDLPKGTSTIPTVSATTKYSTANAVITQAAEIPDTATVVVTAEDGTTTLTYMVIINYVKSTVSTLSDLTVNGTTVVGFDSVVTTYSAFILPGSPVPSVDAVTSDASATYEVTDADTIPGKTTIMVTAEDGVSKTKYTLHLRYALPNDATLSGLTVDGTTVNGFAPNTTSYNVYLPIGTTVVPTVDATPNDTTADVVINAATSIPGTTSVVVTALSGAEKTYQVIFDFVSSIENPGELSLKVYPSVFKDNFRIESEDVINSISVHDITGKVVFEHIGDTYKQTVTVPNAGMYIVQVECNGATRIFRVFKTN